MDITMFSELLSWLDFISQSLWDFISNLDIFLDVSGVSDEPLGAHEVEE